MAKKDPIMTAVIAIGLLILLATVGFFVYKHVPAWAYVLLLPFLGFYIWLMKPAKDSTKNG